MFTKDGCINTVFVIAQICSKDLKCSVTNLIYLYKCMKSICLIMFLLGPAREAFEHGVQLAWGFPPRGKWTYGEVFHPAVVPQPLFRL